MTPDRETLRIIGSWMEDGRTRLPDHVLDAVLDQLPATPQRRPWWSVRRITHVNGLAKYAIAAAAVVVVAIVALTLRGTAAPDQVGGVSPSSDTSPSPSASPAPIAPTSGSIDPGRYRWMSPGGDVTFVLPDGWTGTDYGIVKDMPTHLELAHYMPGSPDQVTRIYTDACESEGRLEPVDPLDGNSNLLSAALENQVGTEAGTSWFSGPDGVTDPPVGQMVEIREEPGLDRSTCRYGAEGPLQIWADPAETTFFALAPGHWGLVYIFGEDGTPFVFTADLGPDATDEDADEVSAIVQSFELSSR
jgi:hypothetical protein